MGKGEGKGVSAHEVTKDVSLPEERIRVLVTSSLWP